LSDKAKLLLMAWLMLVSMAYMIVGDDFTAMIGFPLHEGRMYLQSWLWYIGEHIGLITLSWIALTGAQKHLFAFKIFLTYQVCDMLDFILTDNSVWFSIGFVPVSMNTLGITIFAMSVIKAFIDE
jgi:hypothetical protein